MQVGHTCHCTNLILYSVSSAASWTGWAVTSLTSKLYSAGSKNVGVVGGVADASSTTSTENKSAGEPRGSEVAGRHQPATSESAYGQQAVIMLVCDVCMCVGMASSNAKSASQARQDEREELATDGWGGDQWEVFTANMQCISGAKYCCIAGPCWSECVLCP